MRSRTVEMGGRHSWCCVRVRAVFVLAVAAVDAGIQDPFECVPATAASGGQLYYIPTHRNVTNGTTGSCDADFRTFRALGLLNKGYSEITQTWVPVATCSKEPTTPSQIAAPLLVCSVDDLAAQMGMSGVGCLLGAGFAHFVANVTAHMAANGFVTNNLTSLERSDGILVLGSSSKVLCDTVRSAPPNRQSTSRVSFTRVLSGTAQASRVGKTDLQMRAQPSWPYASFPNTNTSMSTHALSARVHVHAHA